MNRNNPRPMFVASAMLLAVAAGGVAGATQETTMPAAPNAVPGEFLVRFDDDVSEARIAEINARFGVEVASRMLDGKVYLIRVPDPALAADILVLYQATPGVLYIEPNFEVTTQGDAGLVGTQVE